ncbi:MAG TPA: single-stranded DNA-binding protein [Candidatus Acidoferrales bacterium]|nr:single-stranded DNA-binding protein [Candidatus Acidoferrales bacterium]
MADLKMPEMNSVIIAGNLTRDPVFRETTNGTPVVNFTVASNRKFRDSGNQWQEDVCYVGVVAWNKLADSCRDKLKKGNAVLVDGELQSRNWKTDDGHHRSIVEIKARRIQFLNKQGHFNDVSPEQVADEEPSSFTDDSFDHFLSSEESELLKNNGIQAQDIASQQKSVSK